MPWTILNYYGSLFERRRAEVAQRRVPLPLPLKVINVVSSASPALPFLAQFGTYRCVASATLLRRIVYGRVDVRQLPRLSQDKIKTSRQRRRVAGSILYAISR